MFAAIICFSLLVCDREQLVAVVEEDRPSSRRHGRVDGTAHVHFSKYLFLAAMCEDGDVAIFVADVHLAVGDEWRAPDRGEEIVHPDFLTRRGVETVKEPAEI